MAKSRRTKAKHQDFQKVKIKVGKKLPKGLNETKTAFKSKSIQIREQIKQDTNEATTRRKQTIADLLSHCQHYNISARQDAVSGLRELVCNHPEIVSAHLSRLVEKVTPLYLDKEGTVRQAVNRFFKALFENVPAGQIKPFFPVLSAHLRCAMTHIQDDIQIDSLQLMDLLLKHYPQLVTASNNKLMQCFIDQISRKGKEAGSSTRRLIVNPSSKLTGQKWRMKVLERLHSFMMAISCGQHSEEMNKVHTKSWISGDVNEYVPLSQFSSKWMCGVTVISRSHKEHSEDEQTEDLHSRTFIEMLIPLLLQCWVEIGPAQVAADTPGNAMPTDALATLSTILSIILLIQQNLGRTSSENIEWMRTRFMKEFVQYFMTHFPFAAHQPVQGKKKGKNKKDTPQVSCLSINLCVCDVMSHFVKRNIKEDCKWFSDITHYLVQVSQRGHLSTDQLHSALNTVSTLLKLPLEKYDEDEVMGMVLQLYIHKRTRDGDKAVILDFFLTCIEKNTVNLWLTNVRKWMTVLPQHLGEVNGQSDSVTLKLIKVMKVLACLYLPEFRASFQTNSLKILDLIAPGMEEINKSIIELLTHLPHLSRTHFMIITKLCQDGLLSATNLKYLFQVIIYRSHSNDSRQASEDFLSCLTSCLLGYSASDLRALQESTHSDSHISRFSIKVASLDKLQRQSQVTEVLAGILIQVPNEAMVWDAVIGALLDTLVKLNTLPDDLACSVFCTLVNIMRHGYELGEQRLQTSADLASSCLHYVFGGSESCVSNSQDTSVQANLSLTNQCEEFLQNSRAACEMVLQKELHHIMNATNLKRTELHITILTKLLKDDIMRNNLVQKKDEIGKSLQAVEEIHQNIASLDGWSDVKYAVSLLK